MPEPIAIWAGLECTLNRIGDVQHDQLALLGHYDRPDDIDRLAALGVRAIRYPILWERFGHESADSARWRSLDERMDRMRALGVEPIVGLVHHGSGPLDTNLIDPRFADGLAAFARVVSERYPWVQCYTPVNEPLTTARFSALYGLWYPHASDPALFVRATLNQIRAIRLAMRAIRVVRPDAQLVQTEDLGQTHATPTLQYQADFENDRRWLTFDLLTGRVVRGHPMYDYAQWLGITDHEIAEAVGDGCTPGILGINHYVTSERWLDDRIDWFPPHTHGGNHRHRYADVEAVRAVPTGLAGPRALLNDAWARYRLPLAISEIHLCCTREQQLRWLRELWSAAHAARDAGVDVRAATAWAAFGARDWRSLFTRLEGHYEVGLFDIRAPSPRPTALATMVRTLAVGGSYEHPAAAAPGWWRTSSRLAYHVGEPHRSSDCPNRQVGRPLLITGAAGSLGTAFTRVCAERGLACVGITRQDADISNRDAIARYLATTDAWAVVNCAGYVRVDDAERHRSACYADNVVGPVTLAAVCAERGIPMVTFSSDLIFDGRKQKPYVESDRVAPLSTYGASKARAEEQVLAVLPEALVIRTSSFFGPWDDWNFVTRTLRALERGGTVDAANDLEMSPTYLPELVHATLDLLIDGEHGIWHLANTGAVSWAALATMAASAAGLRTSAVRGRSHTELGFVAARPACSALASERASLMSPLEQVVIAFASGRAWVGDPRAESAAVLCA